MKKLFFLLCLQLSLIQCTEIEELNRDIQNVDALDENLISDAEEMEELEEINEIEELSDRGLDMDWDRNGKFSPTNSRVSNCSVKPDWDPYYDYHTPGANNVECGKSTTRPINDPLNRALLVNEGQRFIFNSTKQTRRCVATYEAAGTCPEIRVWCPYFCVPNTDADKCRNENRLYIKNFNNGTQPEVYCNEYMPTIQYPAVGQRLKLWYDQQPPSQSQRYKGVLCLVSCTI